jgi:hypothetical protein
VDSLTKLTSNLKNYISSQKTAESLLVYLKESSKNFRESNVNIVRALLDLSHAVVREMNSGQVFHTVANLITEMLSSGKFDDKIEEIMLSASETMERNQIMVCLLDSFRVKFQNPKIAHKAIEQFSKMTLQSLHQNEEIPMSSLVAICKGGMINPDQKVRSSAIELFISLF